MLVVSLLALFAHNPILILTLHTVQLYSMEPPLHLTGPLRRLY